ncbi:MAG TPA: amino acid adenylation domain-containing protein, partial [Thermoanaerobaculia bacterium]|nr:amino acid adenylation domain-containing protein [Thermoanaerobaculia bacterium]
HQLTLNTLVQGAWALLLQRYSGREDVVFGTVTSGRSAPLPGIEDIVGLFINTLPTRVRVSPLARLALWLQDLQAWQAEMRQFEYTPLVKVRGWSGLEGGTPLFESILVFENYPVDESVRERAGRSLRIGEVEVHEQTHYPLTVTASPGARLGLRIAYETRRFDRATVSRMLGHLESLLSGMAAHPDAALAELTLLGLPERQAWLREWNDTEVKTPEVLTPVDRAFARRAAGAPEAAALFCEPHVWTYGELDRRANRLAHHLRRRGLRREARVGLLLDRSPELLAAVLGVLKSGAAYVPLDPSYPLERLRLMAEDAGISLLLTEERLAGILPDGPWPVLCLDTDGGAVAGESAAAPPPWTGSGDLAYVIYTSGSTGRPKGVQVTHGALANFIASMARRPGFEVGDRLLAVTTLSFDIAGLELLLPLCAGGSVVLARREEAVDGRRLADRIVASGANVMQATPASWRLLLESGWQGQPGLRILSGGEALSRPLAQRLLAAGEGLWNLYGPTETTIWSAASRVEAGDGPVALGFPIANTEVYLLDSWAGPAPEGVPGELYIGGRGLARGYLGQPALTAERFIPDPWSGRAGGRLYRTGDLARRLSGGALDYLSRADDQVKVRGFRIEPGEIEAVLARHPAVREAAVAVKEDAGGDSRLVGYVVPRDEPAADLPAGLRGYLSESLPEHMVPQLFVLLDALPLTPNGKLDRKALPAPDRVSNRPATLRTPIEELLAGLFTEVLGGEEIGVDADFFHHGGHSLSAARLVSRVRAAFGCELPLRAVFEAPTVAALANRISEALRDEATMLPPLVRAPRGRPLPLSFAQERLWFLDRLQPG